MSDDLLLRHFNQLWGELKRDLEALKHDVSRIARQERAEVAASVPVYASLGDLPPAGQLGRLCAVTATGKLYFDSGTTWKEVSLL